VAIILCDTGIALLAYMDGITESRTLSGVVLATLAGAGYAVFRVSIPPIHLPAFGCPIFPVRVRAMSCSCWPVAFQVMFRKVMGDPPVSQIAFIFTALGFLNALLLWPVVLGLYLTGTESLTSESIPWNLLFAASLLLLGRTHSLAPDPTAYAVPLTFIGVINFDCSFPRSDAVQCRRYVQHVCDIGSDYRCARFWWYVHRLAPRNYFQVSHGG